MQGFLINTNWLIINTGNSQIVFTSYSGYQEEVANIIELQLKILEYNMSYHYTLDMCHEFAFYLCVVPYRIRMKDAKVYVSETFILQKVSKYLYRI